MPRKVKFPPAVTDGRLIVVIDGEGERDDQIIERREDMPIGSWGVVPLPVPEDPGTDGAA